MDIKERAKEIIRLLEEEYPNAKTSLDFENPYQLITAVILSAQCTDKRVNMVTPNLFKKYPTPKDLANSDIAELEQVIKSTGFYKNKAKNIKAMAKKVVEEFNNEIPQTMEELLTLPGVARKTANVVLYNAFHKNEGIAVDTHVTRLSNRLGLSEKKDPKLIEKDLMEIVPKDKWGHFTHIMIDHGRAVCVARKPKCDMCVLNKICPSAFKIS